MPNMDPNALPSSSASAAGSSTGPAAKDLLRAISAVAPQLWFPGRHAESTGTPRDSLDEPLWILRQAGMVQVADWIGGLGQGFKLTRDGEKAVDHPEPLSLVDGAARAVLGTNVPVSRALRPAILAPAILVVNLLWFAVGAFLAWKAGVGVEYLKGSGHPAVNQTLMRIGALMGSELLEGGWWRLLACCFVHIGLFHLFGNMLMLGILGPVSEGLWGRRRFALLYLVSGLAGSCAAIALHPMSETENSVRPTVLAGASGALWGVLLSVIVWLMRHREELPEGVAKEWGRKLLFAVFLNLMLSFAPGISVEAHLGGGFAGIALAYWLDRRRWPNRFISSLGVAVLIAVLLGGLYGFMRYSHDWRTVRVSHTVAQGLAEGRKNPDGP